MVESRLPDPHPRVKGRSLNGGGDDRGAPNRWARAAGLLPTRPSWCGGSAAVARHLEPPGGPYLSWSSREARGGHGAQAGARPPPPARPPLAWQPQAEAISTWQPVSHSSDKRLKRCHQGSSCPAAAFTPRNNQVSRLIAAAGCSRYSEQLLPWAFPPGSQAVPTPPSTSGLSLSAFHLCPGPQHRPRASRCLAVCLRRWWAFTGRSLRHPHPAE